MNQEQIQAILNIGKIFIMPDSTEEGLDKDIVTVIHERRKDKLLQFAHMARLTGAGQLGTLDNIPPEAFKEAEKGFRLLAEHVQQGKRFGSFAEISAIFSVGKGFGIMQEPVLEAEFITATTTRDSAWFTMAVRNATVNLSSYPIMKEIAAAFAILAKLAIN